MKNILQLFDDLVVEHGSAKVMAQHRDLFRDKLKDTQQKLEELERKFKEISQENSKLKERLKTFDKPQKLKEKEEEILMFFFHKDDSLFLSEVACQVCLEEPICKYYIEQLIKMNYIEYDMRIDADYIISEDGRAFVVENGLV